MAEHTCQWARCSQVAFIHARGYRHCRRHFQMHLAEHPEDSVLVPAKARPRSEFERVMTYIDGVERALQIMADFPVDFDLLISPCCFRDIVKHRHQAMYRIRMETTLSYPQIGKLFNRDHSTVVHAVQKVQRKSQLARRG
jgi:hypothetical protein